MSELWSSFTTKRDGLVGAALLRVGLSSIFVALLVVNFNSRYLLWGGGGLYPFSAYHSGNRAGIFDLYYYTGAYWYTETLYWSSLLISVAFAIGVQPRALCWPFAILAFATFHRIPAAFDAGASLLRILAIYLCFMDSGRYLRLIGNHENHSASVVSVTCTMMHNAARFMSAFQVCMVYFWASFYKLTGSIWRDGTALHYILQLDRYRVNSHVSDMLVQSGAVTFLTYATLAYQTLFPYVMWFGRTKIALVVLAICMHLGIAFSMGLVSFSATTILADMSLLSDEHWSVLGRLKTLIGAAFSSRLRLRSGPRPSF